ncbi:MAG: hypothetical protein AAGF85_03620 [Bacteroidota bacterium]
MKILLIPIFLLPIFLGAQPQLTNEFYIPFDVEDCEFKTTAFANESFCLPEKPIFDLQVIESITDINELGSSVYFDLKIKQKEAATLKRVIERLNKSSLVIVLNNQLVALANFEQLSSYTTLRFHSSSLQGKINEIHAYLRETIN